jgi:hypothetical protein
MAAMNTANAVPSLPTAYFKLLPSNGNGSSSAIR